MDETAHKGLAAEANNRGWDLVEADRTPAEDLEMLTAVHAAAWHWGKVGGPLEKARAALLAAAAHAQLGHGPVALALARGAWEGIAAAGPAPWERALARGILAHAAYVAGEETLYRDALADAQAASKEIQGEKDREIAGRTLRKLPGFSD